MIALQEFLAGKSSSLDTMTASDFTAKYLAGFKDFLSRWRVESDSALLCDSESFDFAEFRDSLSSSLDALRQKIITHPELYGTGEPGGKVLLDALYEEGIIPTYSFPKNVVSTFITGDSGKVKYQVEHGLDIAIGEYAPGRSIVVDKQTYQIGGLYYSGSERGKGKAAQPARAFIDDHGFMVCKSCGAAMPGDDSSVLKGVRRPYMSSYTCRHSETRRKQNARYRFR